MPQDGKDPEHLREQELPLFPHFNLSHHDRLLTKMGLEVKDEVYVYDFVGFWNHEDVNMTMRVQAGQTLLIRRLGVSECAQIDEMIHAYAPTRTPVPWSVSWTAKHKPDHERDPSHHTTQIPHMDKSCTQVTPPSSPSSRVPSPSPSLSVTLSDTCRSRNFL